MKLKLKIQKGKYIVIDPCYVYPQEKWADFVDSIYPDPIGRAESGEVKSFDGDKFFCFSTAHGDGLYAIYKNNKMVGRLPVDAGLLSIIPLELIEKWSDEYSNGVKVNLLKDCFVEYENGDFSFGDYCVYTR